MNAPTNEAVLAQFLEYLLKLADEKETDAGYSGSHHDGGARELRAQVEIFRAGQDGVIPATWMNEFRKFVNRRDPEQR